MTSEFIGTDEFGNRVVAVRGKSGGCILSAPALAFEDEYGDEIYPTMSLNAASAKEFGIWILGSDAL